LDNTNRSLGRAGAKKVFIKDVGYVYEDPNAVIDKGNAKDETRHVDAASTVLQVDKEHASASRDPSDIARQASNHAPRPSNGLYVDRVLRTDEAIESPSAATAKPQDPEIRGAEPTGMDMQILG
jgi:hypothetical protein